MYTIFIRKWDGRNVKYRLRVLKLQKKRNLQEHWFQSPSVGHVGNLTVPNQWKGFLPLFDDRIYLVLGGFHDRNLHIHDSVHDSTKYLNIPIYQDKFFRNLHDISHINITLYVKLIEKNRGFIPQNSKISPISTEWNFPKTNKS